MTKAGFIRMSYQIINKPSAFGSAFIGLNAGWFARKHQGSEIVEQSQNQNCLSESSLCELTTAV